VRGPKIRVILRFGSELRAILSVTMRYPISDHARELAITDFRFAARADAVLTDRAGRSYLVYAPVWPTPKPRPPAPNFTDVVPAPTTRRVAEWALYAFWGAAAAAAIWFVFLLPRAQGSPTPIPAPIHPLPNSLASFSASLPHTPAP
jgi:hypothetical protein